MYRCLALAVALSCLHVAVMAQVQRLFPADALRGEIVVTAPPEICAERQRRAAGPGLEDTRSGQHVADVGRADRH